MFDELKDLDAANQEFLGLWKSSNSPDKELHEARFLEIFRDTYKESKQRLNKYTQTMTPEAVEAFTKTMVELLEDAYRKIDLITARDHGTIEVVEDYGVVFGRLLAVVNFGIVARTGDAFWFNPKDTIILILFNNTVDYIKERSYIKKLSHLGKRFAAIANTHKNLHYSASSPQQLITQIEAIKNVLAELARVC